MMGLLGDNKRKVAAILGEMPKSKEVPPIEGEFSSAKESLAGEILSALEGKDAKALAKALSHFIVMCEKEESYSEEE